LTDEIGAELLKRRIGVERLVGCVAVHQDRRLVGHHLLQDRHDRLALGEPLATDLGEQLGRVGLVEADRACRPAIGKGEPIEIVEQAVMLPLTRLCFNLGASWWACVDCR